MMAAMAGGLVHLIRRRIAIKLTLTLTLVGFVAIAMLAAGGIMLRNVDSGSDYGDIWPLMVLIGIGPSFGMPETYQVTAALKHIDAGGLIPLITDGRFSGVSTGPCVGHVTPEAAAGGLIGRLRDGDPIRIELAEDPAEVSVADVIRAVDGPLVSVYGVRPESVTYSGSAEVLQKVWIAARHSLRSVFENVSMADLAESSLPTAIEELTHDQDAWQPH